MGYFSDVPSENELVLMQTVKVQMIPKSSLFTYTNNGKPFVEEPDP